MINLCAGPTRISPRVTQAYHSPFTNPDLDPAYAKRHRKAEALISELLHTKARSLILLGEGMLGLDAACASLVEPRSRVLVIDNGIFSHYFADMVARYGAEPVVFSSPEDEGIPLDKLEAFLKEDSNFNLATFCHCETPTGVTSDIKALGQLLRKYDILSIVDAVSSFAAHPIDFDECQLDCLIAGSQKALSCPTGLSLISLSDRAENFIKNRKTPIIGFYNNLANYIMEDATEFPYTQNEQLTYALETALEEALATDSVARHEAFALRVRKAITQSGLKLFAKNSFSNSVSTVVMPEGYDSEDLLRRMREKGYLISGGLFHLKGKVFRLGHMGYNIQDEAIWLDHLKALDESFQDMGLTLKASLRESFQEAGGK